MAIAPLDDMTIPDIFAYVEALEEEIQKLRARTNNRKKLTVPEVKRMRQLFERGDWSVTDLAEAFMVNRSTAYRIINRDYYKNV